MKNTILWGALFTVMCTQVQADVTQTTTPSPSPTVAPAATPAVTQPAPTVQPTPAPTITQPMTSPQTMQQVQPQAAPVINCDYKIPAETKNIDQTLVMNWSEKAVVQTFDFDPANIDAQIAKLQVCFTEPGWTGFNTALQKSGNVEAIKSQKLTVSSQVDGQAQVTDVKDNQWKITLPLQVVYQNDKEKVTQLLNVNVTVGRKISGDLGIMQMIATPRPATTPQPAAIPDASPAPTADTTTPAPSATPTPTSTNGATTEPAVPTPSSSPSDVQVPTPTPATTPN